MRARQFWFVSYQVPVVAHLGVDAAVGMGETLRAGVRRSLLSVKDLIKRSIEAANEPVEDHNS